MEVESPETMMRMEAEDETLEFAAAAVAAGVDEVPPGIFATAETVTVTGTSSLKVNEATAVCTTTNTTNIRRNDTFAHLLEDHHVVLKEKGSPTNATKIFREHICAAFPRSRLFDIEQMNALQNMYYQCKFGSLYPSGSTIPGVIYWVNYELGLAHPQWVADVEDLRFSKKNVAYVRASEECLRDYVRNVGGRSPQDRRQRKRLKKQQLNEDTEEESGATGLPGLTPATSTASATTTTTTTTSDGLSLSPLTIATPPKVFQLVELEDLKENTAQVLEQWKAGTTGYEAMMKDMHILQFWKDYDKYETLLKQHPLIEDTVQDEYQKERQQMHESLLVNIVNSLGNAMVDWYNADFTTRMMNATLLSFSGNSGGNNNNGGNPPGNGGSGVGSNGPTSSNGGTGRSGANGRSNNDQNNNSNNNTGADNHGGFHGNYQGGSVFYSGVNHQFADPFCIASEDSESYYTSSEEGSSEYYWCDDISDDDVSSSCSPSEFSSFVSDVDAEDATSVTYPCSGEDDTSVSADMEEEGAMVDVKKPSSEDVILSDTTPNDKITGGAPRVQPPDALLDNPRAKYSTEHFSEEEEEEKEKDEYDDKQEVRLVGGKSLSDLCARYFYERGGAANGGKYPVDELYMQQCRAEFFKLRIQRLRNNYSCGDSHPQGCLSTYYTKMSSVPYGRATYNNWLHHDVTDDDPAVELISDDLADLCGLGIPQQRLVRTSCI